MIPRLTISYFYFVLGYCVWTSCSSPKTVSTAFNPNPDQLSLAMINGMDDDRLTLVDSLLHKAVDDLALPGVVALIQRNGQIVYHKAVGQANESGEALQKDAIFRIASQTKAITSTAVMMLWEQGLFRLDDPISKYIPEFTELTVLDSFIEADSSYTSIPSEKAITIRHLLTHSSGIGYGVIDGDPRMRKIYAKAGIVDLYTTKDISIASNIKKLAKLPIHHEPGAKFTYSEGLDVLGYFIEIISGQPFDEYLREHIFDPLGMDDTWFYLPKEKHDRLVNIQYKEEGKWTNFPTTFYDPNYPITGAKRFFSGGAGLSSTAEDYAKFLQMYLNDGEYNGNRLLSPTTISTIMSKQIDHMWGNTDKYYGLAFGVLNAQGVANGGQGSKGTFEWGGYFNTQYFADPELDIIGILLKQTQHIDNDPTGWQFRQLVFSSVVK